MKRVQMTLALTAMLAVGTAQAADFSSWQKKMKVTFAGYTQTGTLTNFPALVVLSTSINGFSYGDFKSLTNQDLRFTASDGTSELNYEIESWNTNGSSYVWLQVTNLVDANTFVWAYWGKTGTNAPAYTTNGASWADGFQIVEHMAISNGTTVADASPSNRVAAIQSTPYSYTNGMIGPALGLGTPALRNVGIQANNTVPLGNNWTISSWFKDLQPDGDWRTLARGPSGNHQIIVESGTGKLGSYIGGMNQAGSATLVPVSPSRWRHIAAVGTGSKTTLYVDGVALGTGNFQSTEDVKAIGYYQGPSQKFADYLDEFRIESYARSSNWVWACWLNQASNGVFTGSFNTYGAVQATDPNLPQVSNGPVQNRTDSSADVVGTLITNGTSAATVYLYWSTTDGMTNTSTWLTPPGSVSNLGACVDGTIFTNTLTGLTPNTKYYWNYSASNLSGMAWAATAGSSYFKTMGVPGVDNGGGATSIGPNSATLRGTLTNGASAHVYFHWGNAPDNLPNTLDVGTVSEVPFSQNLTGLDRATTYYYAACASNVYGGEVTVPATNFTTLPYVWITVSTNLVESQTNLWNGVPVVVDGPGVVLTLSSSSTYGNLATYAFGNLIVTNGAAVVGLGQNVSPWDANAKGVAIQSAGDVIVAGGCSINADAKGFSAQKGPGAYYGNWMGATHGGRGDNNANATYGSFSNPTTLGSGGNPRLGGGAIKLIVGSNLVVNGTLSANGTGGDDWAGGGGAGGSIWIAGGTLGGTGEIQVAGGRGEYTFSGGGGGRIAVDDTVTYNFRGNIRGALNTQQGQHGGVGSVYFPALARQDFTVFSNQTLVVGNDIENVFSNLTVYGTLIPGGFYAGNGTGCVIRATNITIAAGGAIHADTWGFAGGNGPATASGTGGSHGGRGGIYYTNALYGSVTQPTSMGSGMGGGAIKLVVSGNLIVTGRLSANGPDVVYATGAGGSIWITGGGLLSGTGDIQAYGGSSYYSNGGGGGRISIDDTMGYAFKGNIRVGKWYDSTPGTLYLPAGARQDFTIDTNQTLVIGNGTDYSFGNLTVKGTLDCGADILGAGTGIVINANNITIASNGVITADSRGFVGGWGPGLGNATIGGTYAGIGYLNTNATYGFAVAPINLGSGASGLGGGAIKLVVKNALTVNGRLSANGGINGANGAGAGGSIWIVCGSLAGTGSVRADGGVSAYGGGGGRIAIRYRGKSLFTGTPAPGLYTNRQSISSTVTVKGGYNTSGDGPEDGSLYIEAVPQGTTFFFR